MGWSRATILLLSFSWKHGLDDVSQRVRKERKRAFEEYGKHHRASRLEQRVAVKYG